MKYHYNGFIPQNIAPKGATKLVVYDSDGNRKGTVPLGFLERLTGEKLYSFGLISDLHVIAEQTETSEYLDNALTYFEEQGCLFCCHGGDITNIGFWYNSGDTEIYLGQFTEYKRICDLHPNIPVYGICGNHENYNKVITENLTELEEYTGHGLYYTVQHEHDLFIFIGQPVSYQTINLEELQWLYETLEANRNIRCHVFVHVFPSNDSGNAMNAYESYFGQYESHVKALLNHYKNTVLYHGHSHNKFKNQEIDKCANYTDKNGYHSVHIPATGGCNDVIKQEDGSWERLRDRASAEAYLVDVYEDYIVLNGFDVTNNSLNPLGTFKIDTKLVEIEANTFTDSTGTINTI